MRLRLGSSRDGEASVVVLDPASGLWVPLVDAVKGGGRGERSKWPHGDGPLRDVTAFLGLGRESGAPPPPSSRPPRRPAAAGSRRRTACRSTSRAFATRRCVAHMAQASKGFFPVALSCGHAVQLVLQNILGKALRLPRVLGPCGVPPFYVGNPRTIVLINDFSARDVQADEMASVGFGFVKCKSFCTAMGSDVVTADELWMHTDMGKMFCGEGLKCEVRVNGEPRGPPGNTAARRCCLLSDYVKHVALGEGLHPGEVLGLGTVPGCCGLEIGEWLKPGDEVTVACEGLGTVTNTIPAPVAGPTSATWAARSTSRAPRVRVDLPQARVSRPAARLRGHGRRLPRRAPLGRPEDAAGPRGVAVGGPRRVDGAPGADNSGVEERHHRQDDLAKAD
ncbi:Fumarylacetoacetate (FAA) hydrolase-like protein [Aureococcus anophagefferens]|nr:Fumarylacetoacetate (FAA) hydrolase-like protein [Aureococcus anophagefferens]